jgi:hypothetical protein
LKLVDKTLGPINGDVVADGGLEPPHYVGRR